MGTIRKITLRKLSLIFAAALFVTAIPLSFTSCEREEACYVPDFEEDERIIDKSDYPYIPLLDEYKKTDWSVNTKWIWTENSHPDQHQAFRKNFTLNSIPETAVADVACENNYYLWVNGQLAVFDGGSNRGPTPYDAYYDEVDLRPYLIKGDNNITILVEYIGRASSSLLDVGQGGLLFEMKLPEQTISSNHLFLTKEIEAYRTKEDVDDYPSTNPSAILSEWNVYYDSRLDEGEFYEPSFDDSAWESARLVSTPGTMPFNDTCLNIGEIAFDKALTSAKDDCGVLNKEVTQETQATFSLPENMQYSLSFTVLSNRPGLKIQWHSDTYEISSYKTFIDTYITKRGEQSFECLPYRSGSKIIFTLPSGVTLKSVSYRRSGFASTATSEFSCSDENLNKLYERAGNTLEICMRDFYMDCPDRERSPWLGDASSQIKSAFYLMDDNATLLSKKMILTMLGWTNRNNIFPSRLPTSASVSELPSQNLHFLTAVYDYCFMTGDLATAKAVYPLCVNYLKNWAFDDNGNLIERKGSWQWYDWGLYQDKELLEIGWYAYALNSVSSLATLIGETADQNFFLEREALLKRQIATYKGNGYQSKSYYADDRANALFVVSNLVSEEDYPMLSDVLLQTKHASPYMEQYADEALCRMGKQEESKERMLQRYSLMLSSNDTTLWEGFEKSSNTNDHGWSAGAGRVIQQYYAGISPLKAGYEEYSVSPVPFLSEIHSQVSCVKGKITLDVTKRQEKTVVTVTSPGGKCFVRLNKAFGFAVTTSKPCSLKEEDEEYFTYAIDQGTYTFEIC